MKFNTIPGTNIKSQMLNLDAQVVSNRQEFLGLFGEFGMKLKPLVGKHIGPKNIDKTRSQPNYPSQASSEDNLLFF